MSFRFYRSLAMLAAACTLYGLGEVVGASSTGMSWTDALWANWLPLSAIPIAATVVLVIELVSSATTRKQ